MENFKTMNVKYFFILLVGMLVLTNLVDAQSVKFLELGTTVSENTVWNGDNAVYPRTQTSITLAVEYTATVGSGTCIAQLLPGGDTDATVTGISTPTVILGTHGATFNVILNQNFSTSIKQYKVEFRFNNGGVEVSKTFWIFQRSNAPYIASVILNGSPKGIYRFGKGETIPIRLVYSESGMTFTNQANTYVTLTGTAGTATVNSNTGGTVSSTQYLDYNFVVPSGFEAKEPADPLKFVEVEDVVLAQQLVAEKPTGVYARNILEAFSNNFVASGYYIYVDGVEPTVTVGAADLITSNAYTKTLDMYSSEPSTIFYLIKTSEVTSAMKADDALLLAYCNSHYNTARTASTTPTGSTATLYLGSLDITQGAVSEAYSAFAVDAYGNVSTNPLTITVKDGIKPWITTYTLTTSLGTLVPGTSPKYTYGKSGIKVAATFSELVQAAPSIKFTIGGTASTASATSVPSILAKSFAYSIFPNKDGLVSIDLATNGYSDVAGNEGTNGYLAPADIYNYTGISAYYDSTSPSPTIIKSSVINTSNVTNQSTVILTVNFSEPMPSYSFPISYTVTNGVSGTINYSNRIDANGQFYTFTVSPTIKDWRGVLSVNVAGGYSDYVGNLSNSASFSFEYNGTVPTPTFTLLNRSGLVLSGVQYTNVLPNIQLAFDEQISPLYIAKKVNYGVSKATIANGTISTNYSINSVSSGWIYTFDLNPTVSDGILSVAISPNNQIYPYDIAKYGSTISETASLTFVYDNVAPIASVVFPKTLYKKSEYGSISFLFSFNEPVYDAYPSSDVTVTDGLGNLHAINQVSTTQGGLTYAGSLVMNTPIPTVNTDFYFDVAANVVSDRAGNYNNSLASKVKITYDPVSPTPTIIANVLPGALYGPNMVNPIILTVDFGEAVTGFTTASIATKLYVDSFGSIGTIDATKGIYSFTVTPSNTVAMTTNTVTIGVNDSGITDLAGNLMAYDPQYSLYSFEYDNSRPSVTIESTYAYNTTTLVTKGTFTVTFDEVVTFLNSAQVVVTDITGATTTTAVNWAPTDLPNVYTFDFTIDANPVGSTAKALVTVDFPANWASDMAMNGNSLSKVFTASGTKSSFVFNYDGTLPIPTISSPSWTDYTSTTAINSTVIRINVDYGSVIKASSFGDGDDITVTFVDKDNNVSVVKQPSTYTGAFDTDNRIYTFDIKNIDVNTTIISVNIPENVVVNSVGNINTSATAQYGSDNFPNSAFTILYDRIAPIATLYCTSMADATSLVHTNISPVYFTVNFGENLSGDILSSIEVKLNGAVVSTSVLQLLDNQLSTNGIYSFAVNTSIGGEGTYTVQLLDKAIADAAGNFVTSTAIYTFDYSTTQPKPTVLFENNTLASVSPEHSNKDFAVTIAFDEAMLGLNTTAVYVSIEFTNKAGVTTSSIEPVYSLVDNTNGIYSFTLSNTEEGTFVISVNSNAGTDIYGNTSVVTPTSTSSLTVVYDAVHPIPTISTYVGYLDPARGYKVTNVYSTIPVTVDFGEKVLGFDAANTLLVVNGTYTYTGTSDNQVFSFEVTPSVASNDLGTIMFYIKDGAVTDYSMNTSSHDNAFAAYFAPLDGQYQLIDYDGVAPVPVVTLVNPTSLTNPTNVTPIVFSVQFGEEIWGFDSNDVTITSDKAGVVSNAIIDSYGCVDSTIGLYTFNIQNFVAGTEYTIDVPANGATDIALGFPGVAGNLNVKLATPFVFVWDNTGPYATIKPSTTLTTVADLGVTNQTTVNFFVDFGRTTESGKTVNVIANNNGTNPVVTSVGPDYTFAVSNMVADSWVTLSVSNDAIKDITGNYSSASAVYSFLYDVTAPAVGFTIPTFVNATSPLTFSAADNLRTYNSGYDNATITVSKGGTQLSTTVISAGTPAFSGFSTGLSDGDLFDVSVTAWDKAGNSTVILSSNITYDTSSPVPVITVINPSAYVNVPAIFTVNFGEAISSFTTAAITIRDASTNYDYIANGVFSFNIVEAVPGVPGMYTVQLDYMLSATPTTISNIKMLVPAGSAFDLAGNPSLDGSFVFTYDTTNPRPTITLANEDYTSTFNPQRIISTNSNLLNFRATFNKPVWNFDPSDIVVSGGTLVSTTFTPGNSYYDFEVNSLVDGQIVSVNIAAGAANDNVGNPSLSSRAKYIDDSVVDAGFSILYDVTGPKPTVTVPGGASLVVAGAYAIRHTSVTDLIFTVNFGEDVTGFVASDIALTGFTSADLNASPIVFTNANGFVVNVNAIEQVPTGRGVYIFDLQAASAVPFNENITLNVTLNQSSDAAGNAAVNNFSALNIWWDTTKPTPTFTVNGKTISGDTKKGQLMVNTNPAIVSVTFGENVDYNYSNSTPFNAINYTGTTALSESNGLGVNWTLNSFDGAIGYYGFKLNLPTTSKGGNVQIDITAGAASDAVEYGVRNENPYSPVFPTDNLTAIGQFTFTYDFVAPIPTIYSSWPLNTVASLTDRPISMWVDFGEGVEGFSSEQIKVSLSNLQYARDINGTKAATYTITADPTWKDGDSKYYFTLYPSEFSALISVEIPAGVASDFAGNMSSASVPSYDNNVHAYTIAYDGCKPYPSFSFLSPELQARYAAGIPLNASQVPATIVVDFGEAVTGMAESLVTVQNCSLAKFGTMLSSTGAYNVYTFTVMPTQEGIILSLNIDADVVTDNHGNSNYLGLFNFKYEGLSPFALFDATTANKYPVGVSEGYEYYTNQAIIPMTVSFDEKVVGFSSALIQLNGSSPVLYPTFSNYTFTDVIEGGKYVAHYNFVPTATGVYSFNVPGNTFQDVNGNWNTDSYPRPMVIHYDTTAPVATITANVVNSLTTNKNPFVLTVNFGEIVTGFTATDLATINVNGTVTNFLSLDGGRAYQFEVSPVKDGIVSVSFDATAAVYDLAGNISTGATFTILYDATAPKPSIATSANIVNPTYVTLGSGLGTGYIGATAMPFTIYFKDAAKGNNPENVQSLEDGEFVTNFGTLTSATKASAGVYNFTLTTTGAVETVVTVEVKSNVVTDDAGNVNLVNAIYQFNYDGIAPQISGIANASYDALNFPRFVSAQNLGKAFTITFSEKVTGFDSNDITVSVVNKAGVKTIITNPTINGLSATAIASSFNFTIDNSIPEGTVSVDVQASVASDFANNVNANSYTYTFVYDATAPVATMSCAQGSVNPNNHSQYTNAKPGDAIVIAADFGELVDGINLQYVTATTIINGKTVKYTTANPTPDIDVEEPVSVYSFEITNLLANLPTAQAGSVITVTVDSKSVTKYATADLAGNINKTSTFTIAYDVVAPAPTVTGIVKQYVAGSNGTAAPLTIVVDMKEAVKGFLNTDLLVTNNGVALNSSQVVKTNSGVDGDAIYTFVVTPTSDGLITVSVPANVATDYALNENVVSNIYSIYYDTQRPVPSISGISGNVYNGIGYTNVSPVLLTVNFSEPVYNFEGSEFTVNNGSINDTDLNPAFSTTVAAVNYTTKLYPTIPTAQAGTIVTVSITYDANIFDAAGNNNTDSNVYSVVYDNQAPHAVVTINPIYGTPYVSTVVDNVAAIVSVTFDEKVVGLTTLDLSSGSSKLVYGDAVNGSTVYAFEVTGYTSEQLLVVNVATGAGSDYAGNACNPATNSLYIDVTHPVPTVSTTGNLYQSGVYSTIPITVTFPETVQGLRHDVLSNDVKVTYIGGTGVPANDINISVLLPATNTTTYGFTFLPIASGITQVMIEVPTNITSDMYGNGNAHSNVLTIYYDNVAPTPTITSRLIATTDQLHTNDNPIYFEANFGEAIKYNSAVSSVFNVTGGTYTVSSSDNQHFTVAVTPSANGIVAVDVLANVCSDLAGNKNNAAKAVVSVIYDNVVPTPSITSVLNIANPTNASTIDMLVDFKEPVVGFTVNDLTVNGATVASVTPFGANGYTFTLANLIDGNVSVEIAANQASDLATNTNAASNKFTITVDRVAPVPTIYSTLPNYSGKLNGNVPVFVAFNEPVTGLALANIFVSGVGSTTGTLTAISSSLYSFNIAPTATVGTIFVNMGAGAAKDLSGNNSTSANFAFVFDGQGPIPVITVSPDATTNVTSSNPFTVKVNFGEDVEVSGKKAFSASAVVVTRVDNSANLAIGSFQKVSTGVYTFTVNLPAGIATDVYVSIAADVCQDVYGNYNSGNDATIRYDQKAPVVTLGATRGAVTNISPIEFTIGFDETIASFATSKVKVSGISSAATVVFQQLTTGSYHVIVTDANLTQGNVVLTVPAYTALDFANNGNAAVAYTVTFDKTRPTPTITLNPSVGPTNAAYIGVTINFGKKVVAFDAQNATQCVLSSGQVASLSTAKAEQGIYTFQVAPDIKQGTFAVTVPYGQVFDLIGNFNDVATAAIIYDVVKPQPTIIDVVADGKNKLITATVVFNENVNFNSTSYIKLTSGSVITLTTAVQGVVDGNYYYDITATGMVEGQVAITIPANQFTDVAGNLNIAAEPVIIDYRITGPKLEILTPAAIAGQYTPVAPTTALTYSADNTLVGVPYLSVDGGTTQYPVLKQGLTLADIMGADFAKLADGNHIITLSGQNAGGLVGTAVVSVTLDKIAPVVDITTPVENATVAADADILFTVDPITDVAQPIRVELTVNGLVYTKDITSSVSSVSLKVQDLPGYATLVTGDAITVKVTVTDKSGNVGSDVVHLQYNSVTALPVVTVITTTSLTNAANVAATLQSTALGYVYIVQDGTVIAAKSTLAETLVEIQTAVAANKASIAPVTVAGQDVPVSTYGLLEGTYRAYALDLTGRTSVNVADPITIVEGVLPRGDFKFITSLNVAYFEGVLPNGGEVAWDFGDGKTSPFGYTENNLTPTYTYKTTGTFVVTMYVRKNGVVWSYKTTVTIDVISGVENTESKVAVNVYPNPCGVDKFTYSYENSVNVDKATLTIYDINGKVILVDKISVNGKSFIKDYNVSGYSKGTYLIQVEANGAVETKRLVIR